MDVYMGALSQPSWHGHHRSWVLSSVLPQLEPTPAGSTGECPIDSEILCAASYESAVTEDANTY